MITGDNPLTAVHVAREVDIVDRDALILDVKEGAANERGEYHRRSSIRSSNNKE